MIIGEQKPLPEILDMVQGYVHILVAGCEACVAVCLVGGAKEVAVIAAALRLAAKEKGRELQVEEASLVRQCEWEYVESLKEQVERADAVLSTACGVGVQTMARKYAKPVLPAINTTFLGMPEQPGFWTENCGACGDCVLDETGGVCPIVRCAKSMLNGPCGGSQGGKCEVNPDTECGWQLIYDRLTQLGQTHLLTRVMEPKDWSKERSGGPRRLIRKDIYTP